MEISTGQAIGDSNTPEPNRLALFELSQFEEVKHVKRLEKVSIQESSRPQSLRARIDRGIDIGSVRSFKSNSSQHA